MCNQYPKSANPPPQPKWRVEIRLGDCIPGIECISADEASRVVADFTKDAPGAVVLVTGPCGNRYSVKRDY